MKTSLWATLVALFTVCGCEARAAEIPEFWLTVPSREHACSDTATTEIDDDLVTVNVSARNSWTTLVKTFYQIARDTPFPVRLTTAPGAGGYYQVQWRVSEPPRPDAPLGVIGCWSPQVGMIGLGW